MTFSFEDLERLAIEVSPSGMGFWANHHAKIQDKKGHIIDLKMNPLQSKMAAVVDWCLENDLPIRMICLKARQVGCSTFSTAILNFLARRSPNNAMIMGNYSDQSDNLMGILRRYIELDEYDWGQNAEVGMQQIRFSNGSLVKTGSAQNPEKPRSGCYRLFLCTEVARWAEEGVANADAVLGGLMESVPMEGGTCVIMESTARGPSGLFYETWNEEAITLEEAKEMGPNMARGKFIKVFSPWFDHDDCALPLNEEERARVMAELDETEQLLIEEYGITAEQIQFRRVKLQSPAMGRDPNVFKQEYPCTPEEAFVASSPSFFYGPGLQRLRVEASQPTAPRKLYGIYVRPDEKADPIWTSVLEEDAMWWRWEDPRPGCHYLISADFMSGREDESKKRDNHAVFVIRRGYLDPIRGVWHPPALVARTVSPCQWALPLLEDEIYNAWQIWGRCLVVPEANFDGGVIRGLVDRGVTVYRGMQNRDSAGNQIKPKPLSYYGLLMQGSGRVEQSLKRRLMEKVNAAIRDLEETGGLEIWDTVTIKEMEVFCQNKAGKLQALGGKHDDSVIALAIGLWTLEAATLLKQQTGGLGALMGDPLARGGAGPRGGSRRSGARI